MDLIDQLKDLATSIDKKGEKALTEEATKNAFVMPFINALGYNVFDPDEVVPEFNADHGIKKGEKVDYAIMRDEMPVMLFECKKYGTDLKKSAPSQLYRYFSVTKAKIGIVTDGDVYHFYTDLEESNKMDDRPYMELKISELDENLIPQLKKLTKTSLDLDRAIENASELKYTKEIRRKIGDLIEEPTKEFVKYFTSLVYDGRFTHKIEEQFTPIVKKAFNQFIRQQINERLESAIVKEEQGGEAEAQAGQNGEQKAEETNDRDSRIETTEEEIEAYHIVKSIVREVVDPDRVHFRDTISYMGVLLDDNNRQPICRLHFNTGQKYIGLFDKEKNEVKKPIESLNEIFEFSNELKRAARFYE